MAERSNTMSDQDKKEETSIPPQPDAENKKQSTELSEEELKKVTGGESISFNFTKLK
jgi:bacteriocin-like protein